MYCISPNRLSNRQRKLRMVVFAFLICIIAGFLLSEVFVLTHANHKHDNNGIDEACAACVQIQNAENVLKQFRATVIGSLFILSGLFAIYAFAVFASFHADFLSLVTLKTKMNN